MIDRYPLLVGRRQVQACQGDRFRRHRYRHQRALQLCKSPAGISARISANTRLQVKQTEDTITLLVEWESLTPEKRKGTAGMCFSLRLRFHSGCLFFRVCSLHCFLDSTHQEWSPLGTVLPLHGFQGRDQRQPGQARI
jgi:hypothetical protein